MSPVDLDNVDVSRERYNGYSSQTAYQRDLRKFYDGKICGALTNQRKFCTTVPMENGRCRLHGGKSLNGLDHPRTKHGGYSKYIPKALMEKYKDAQENEDLLSLREETALITTRIYELTEKAQETSGKKKFKEVIELYNRWQSAERKGIESAFMIKNDLEDVLDQVEKDLKVWDEIADMVNLKRRLVDSEQKKMNNMQQYVPVDKVMLLIGALMDIVVTEIESLDGVLMNEEMIEQTNTKIARKFHNITKKNDPNYNGSE